MNNLEQLSNAELAELRQPGTFETIYNPQVAPVVKNPPANAGAIRDGGLIPCLGRSPGGDMATHSGILAWRIPWAEEPGGLQAMRPQRVGHD